MDTVIYSENSTPQVSEENDHYNALKLEKLPPQKLAKIRTKLYCSTCFEKAAYVSRSSNGRSPHCRSVHQKIDGNDCPQKSAESEKVDTKGYDSVQALKNEEDVYKIDFNFDIGEPVVNPKKPKEDTDNKGRRKRGNYRKFGEASGHGKSEWSRRLSTLLKTLKDDPDFAKSSALIKVMGKNPTPINKLFFFTDNFADYMDYLAPGQYPAFFWGSIWNAKKGGLGDIWLNTGESSTDLSVKLPSKVSVKIREKLKLTEDEFLESLSGSWFLLYGWYNRSKQTGKPTLNLLESQSEFITLRLGQKI